MAVFVLLWTLGLEKLLLGSRITLCKEWSLIRQVIQCLSRERSHSLFSGCQEDAPGLVDHPLCSEMVFGLASRAPRSGISLDPPGLPLSLFSRGLLLGWPCRCWLDLGSVPGAAHTRPDRAGRKACLGSGWAPCPGSELEGSAACPPAPFPGGSPSQPIAQPGPPI